VQGGRGPEEQGPYAGLVSPTRRRVRRLAILALLVTGLMSWRNRMIALNERARDHSSTK
jgi:hypothetical protein